MGDKKAVQQPTSVIDPDTKTEVFDHDEINRVLLTHFTRILTTNPPHDDYKDTIKTKNELHILRINRSNDINDDDDNLTIEDFETALEFK